MSKKIDPLEIENVGEDVYILRSRGHHDPHEFMRKVRADGYDWPLGMPEHLWCRTVPTRKKGYNCIYVLCKQGERGAYPVTYVQEAWGADSYEAITESTK
jgi:hypothetical protein